MARPSDPRAPHGVFPSLPTLSGDPCTRYGCSACCHDIEMLLTEADRARIAAVVAADPESARRAAQEAWMFEAEDGYLQLRTRDGPPAPGGEGRPCWFLGGDGRCTIHAARPEGCRLYPAVWDEGLREAVLDADYCPHTDAFFLPQAMHDATRRLVVRLQQERTARLRQS